MKNNNILFAHNYYIDKGARELAHLVKNKDPSALQSMATEMASILPLNTILIPVPSRLGYATETLIISKLIIEINGGKICDIIKGKKRDSLYYLKKDNKNIPNDFFGFHLNGREPDQKFYILDTVCDTQTTLNNIETLFKNPLFVVHSKVFNQI